MFQSLVYTWNLKKMSIPENPDKMTNFKHFSILRGICTKPPSHAQLITQRVALNIELGDSDQTTPTKPPSLGISWSPLDWIFELSKKKKKRWQCRLSLCRMLTQQCIYRGIFSIKTCFSNFYWLWRVWLIWQTFLSVLTFIFSPQMFNLNSQVKEKKNTLL